MTNPKVTLDDEVQELKKRKYLLNANNESFAHNLIQFYEQRGYLSARQLPWIRTLLARCNDAEHNADKQVEEVFNGSALRNLFIKASSNLKWPSLKLQDNSLPSGQLHFYRAGALSKSPGFILITNGKKYPNRATFGSINLKGEGTLLKQLNPLIKQAILKVAADPVNAAKLTGIRFSHCCFCGLELTAKISLHHGYGPICASNWGLPWEGSAEETIAEKKREREVKLIDLGGEGVSLEAHDLLDPQFYDKTGEQDDER